MEKKSNQAQIKAQLEAYAGSASGAIYFMFKCTFAALMILGVWTSLNPTSL